MRAFLCHHPGFPKSMVLGGCPWYPENRPHLRVLPMPPVFPLIVCAVDPDSDLGPIEAHAATWQFLQTLQTDIANSGMPVALGGIVAWDDHYFPLGDEGINQITHLATHRFIRSIPNHRVGEILSHTQDLYPGQPVIGRVCIGHPGREQDWGRTQFSKAPFDAFVIPDRQSASVENWLIRHPAKSRKVVTLSEWRDSLWTALQQQFLQDSLESPSSTSASPSPRQRI